MALFTISASGIFFWQKNQLERAQKDLRNKETTLKIFSDEAKTYEVIAPIIWTNYGQTVERLTNKEELLIMAPDKSTFEVDIRKTDFNNLDDYLKSIDSKSDACAGNPCIKTFESKNVTIDNIPAIQRIELFTYVGGLFRSTYFLRDGKIYILKTSNSYENYRRNLTNDAEKNYTQILSTFKFL